MPSPSLVPPRPVPSRKDLQALPVTLEELFGTMVDWDASDLHLSSGLPPAFRVYGDIYVSDYPALRHEHIMTLVSSTMSPRDRELFQSTGDVDYSTDVPGRARFRINCMQQQRGMAAVFHRIPHEIPRLDDLGLPPAALEVTGLRRGLVLVTGATGSGKSTTLAAVLDVINRDRQGHIITIENPVEFVHENVRCLVTQREVGRDAQSFAEALREAVREDPDIILVGDIRDPETVELAVRAADMGLLVLGSVHASSASRAVECLIDVFPVEQQDRMRSLVADSLRAVIAQNLVPRMDGQGRVGAFEFLINTPTVGTLIREGKTQRLSAVLQSSREASMQTMDMALIALVKTGLIAPESAYERATDPRALQKAGIVCEEPG